MRYVSWLRCTAKYVSNHSNKKFLLSRNEFLFSLLLNLLFLDFVTPTFTFHFEHLIVPLLLSRVHCWQGGLVFFLRGFNSCRPGTGWYFFIQLQFLKTNNKDCIGCGLQCTICTSPPYKLLTKMVWNESCSLLTWAHWMVPKWALLTQPLTAMPRTNDNE